MKSKEIALFQAMRKIISKNTKLYQSDFDIDRKKILEELNPQHPKSYIWMSRRCGTQCIDCRIALIRDTSSNIEFLYYAHSKDDSILPYLITPKRLDGDTVMGTMQLCSMEKLLDVVKRNSCEPMEVRIKVKKESESKPESYSFPCSSELLREGDICGKIYYKLVNLLKTEKFEYHMEYIPEREFDISVFSECKPDSKKTKRKAVSA